MKKNPGNSKTQRQKMILLFENDLKIPEGAKKTNKIGQKLSKLVYHLYNFINIAGRLPENRRNSFVDLQSKKNSAKDTKNSLFIEV